jgi:hypothetical protein
MKPELKYIELKSGYSDDGPAWIGMVQFSKSGQTIYFNGKAFKGNGHGLCFDIETKDTYWITGIKKEGQNRHWAGGGKIMIDRVVVDDYLKLKGWSSLNLNNYELVDIIKTDKQRFAAIENRSFEVADVLDKYSDLNTLTKEELKNAVELPSRMESNTNSNNGVKYITVKRIEAERLLTELIA